MGNAHFKKLRETKGNCCHYCGDTKKLTVDHKIPLVKGGDRFARENLLVACEWCNHVKSNADYDTFVKFLHYLKDNGIEFWLKKPENFGKWVVKFRKETGIVLHE